MRTIENKFIRLLVALIIPSLVLGYGFLLTEYPIIAGAITVILSLIVLTYIIYKFLTP
jgi:hypothetical protein